MSTATEDLSALMTDIATRARAAAAELVKLIPAQKNEALEAMAAAIDANRETLKRENAKDLEAGREKGLTPAMLKRLELSDTRLDEMVMAVRDLVALPDPVGEMFDIVTRPNGLKIGKLRTPLGVIGIVYESRPNVTSDAGSLCLKSGNAVILRGGSEAFHSNTSIIGVMREALESTEVPADAIQLIPNTDRGSVTAMLHLEGLIDVVIPRGGPSLIKTVVREARMPVIKHYDGICHVFVDREADLEMAESITVNSKTQYPSVCNSLETLLVHHDVAEKFLPRCLKALKDKGVEIRGDEFVCALDSDANPATEEDWVTEYLDLILSVKVIDSFDSAVAWINDHGSQHTESIVTRDHETAMRFLNEVDSACVFVNASTRFADGARFGLGCEIGISTDKLHARGPMGLKELTTSKWIALGQGQIVT